MNTKFLIRANRNTNQWDRYYREETQDQHVAQYRQLLDDIQPNDPPIRLPCQGEYYLRIEVKKPRCLTVTIQNREARTLATLGVATHEQCGRMWPLIVPKDTPPQNTPPIPWISAHYTEATSDDVARLAEVERAIAWAWMERRMEIKTQRREEARQRVLVIENEGPSIAHTNFWETALSHKGYFYLSWNASAARLLVPDSHRAAINDMRSASTAIISGGPWEEQGGQDALEVLFEDNSDAPYAIQLLATQTNRLPSNEQHGQAFELSVWHRTKKIELPARYRTVPTIPWLKEWEEK